MSANALVQLMEGVIASWKREGIELLPPMDPATVIAELSKTGQRYSEDVVDLYCTTGGMIKDEMDSHCFSMWPFDKVVRVNNKRSYLAFADFLISSHFYGFVYESKARSKVCIDYGKDLEIIANSVEEFFQKLMIDPGQLYMLKES
jgi:hypothetical protein